VLLAAACLALPLAGRARRLSAQATRPVAAKARSTLFPRILIRSSVGDSVVRLAESQLGLAYRFGAKLPGRAFDCSGLVQWIMSKVDLVLPRTARLQSRQGEPVPKDPSRLLPGDLLFFGHGARVSHVGIYVGDGRYIHAANRKLGIVEALLPTGVAARTWWKSVRRVVPSGAAMVISVSDSLFFSS
jgi:cell wall-associated NlpC family hydrolase